MANHGLARFTSLTVDLDPLRSYLENRRLTPAPETDLEAVMRDGLPRILDLLSRLGIPATFFVVGQDARDGENARWLRAAVAQGHEVACHSDRHLPDFDRLPRRELALDIGRSREALESATGRPVTGFRAPAWNIPRELFEILVAQGFEYDSSLVSRPAGPWRVAALRLLKTFSPSTAPHRIMQGQPAATVPHRPYPMDPARPWLPCPGSSLWEIPHGCSAGPLPVPLNGTVLGWLPDPITAGMCRLCARRPEPLIFVCHGIDLVDFHRHVRDPRLRGKPGLTAPIAAKERRLSNLLRALGAKRTWVTLRDLRRACADAVTAHSQGFAPDRTNG